MPRVSVVLPCFNAAAYLGEAIDSILGQTLQDLELIVVDDASTDASADIARACRDPRVRLTRLASNSGYPVAMNHGLALVRSPYVARMDADDTCRPTRLAVQVELLDREPRLTLVGSEWYLVTPGGRVHERPGPIEPEGRSWREESWQSLYDGTRRFNDPSAVARTQAVRDAGGYRTYQRSVQDLDLWLRLAERGGGVASCLTPLYGRRLNPRSLVYSGRRALFDAVPRRLADDRRARGSDAVMRGEPLPESGVEEADARRATVLGLIEAARICGFARDRAGEREFLKRALAMGGLSPGGARAAWELLSRSLF